MCWTLAGNGAPGQVPLLSVGNTKFQLRAVLSPELRGFAESRTALGPRQEWKYPAPPLLSPFRRKPPLLRRRGGAWPHFREEDSRGAAWMEVSVGAAGPPGAGKVAAGAGERTLRGGVPQASVSRCLEGKGSSGGPPRAARPPPVHPRGARPGLGGGRPRPRGRAGRGGRGTREQTRKRQTVRSATRAGRGPWGKGSAEQRTRKESGADGTVSA